MKLFAPFVLNTSDVYGRDDLNNLLGKFKTVERDHIKGNNPPTFILSGSGRLAMLRIHGPKVRDVPGEAGFAVWEIIAKSGRFNGTLVGSLGSITYGKVPDGYVQVYPERGEAPPLLEGEQYRAFFDTVNANGARKSFTIRDGKVVDLMP